MKFDRRHARITRRILYTLGILISLATFILHAIPVNWGIFLSSACFIVGAMFWGGWRENETRPEERP